MQRIKQVILIRKDLNMRRGKEIAQGSHASMEFLVQQILDPALQLGVDSDASARTVVMSPVELNWLSQGKAKVCLRVNSEQELFQHHEQALAAGIKSYLIQDSGRTEFRGQPTYTACALGPDEAGKIDRVTGDLVPY